MVSGAIAILTASSAAAHDIWLTVDKKGEQFSAQLHNGDTDKRDMSDRNRIVTLELVTPAGTVDLRRPLTPGQVSGQPMLETKPFSVPEQSLLAVSYDNGFWINHPQTNAEINTTKLTIAGGASPHWTVKYGKALLGPGAFEKVLHTRLEFVALKDPYRLALGEKLPVRLELNGKPFAGAQVAYSDGTMEVTYDTRPVVKTGSDGIVEIPMSRKGPYLLSVDCEAPPLYPPLSEHDHLYASLTFDTSK